MISARKDIATGTKESIAEWGFSIDLVYPDGSKVSGVTANGRKASSEYSQEGLKIVNKKPYLVIAREDLTTIPGKGCTAYAPTDFFRPSAISYEWYSVESAQVTDDDWFVRIYLTKTGQSV